MAKSPRDDVFLAALGPFWLRSGPSFRPACLSLVFLALVFLGLGLFWPRPTALFRLRPPAASPLAWPRRLAFGGGTKAPCGAARSVPGRSSSGPRPLGEPHDRRHERSGNGEYPKGVEVSELRGLRDELAIHGG